ncbi:MAG: GNAT family N-acetyltransferase [Armatimonadetes bacterium]|nr:GNAT family N-acetyltransferase [Armatimonadota bacterium]
MAPDVLIRPFDDGDSYEELTELLHRAYAGLAERGWNFTASYQDVATTRDRVAKGDTFVAVDGTKLVGTVTIGTDVWDDDPELYQRDDVAVLCQFGVLPEYRGHMTGDALYRKVVDEARARGYSTVGLDTPETATHLIEYYQRRGFEVVGHHQWHGKTYRSVVMAKPVPKD